MNRSFVILLFLLSLSLVACSSPEIAPAASIVVGFDPSVVEVDGKAVTLRASNPNEIEGTMTLAVSFGGGENSKKVQVDELISFGEIRLCVTNLSFESTPAASVVATTSSRAVAWYTFILAHETPSCELFARAIAYAPLDGGAGMFFNELIAPISSDAGVINRAYQLMLGSTPDALALQAWQFYIRENGPRAFVEELAKSDEFKRREESVK